MLDAAILSVQKVPMITDLSTEYGRHVMRWKVKGMKSYRNNEPARDVGTVSYKATVFPKDHRIAVTVHIPGADNLPRGDGVCVKKTK